MKDFVEITLIWITNIFWLVLVFAITSVGLAILKSLDLTYENSVCTIYGSIIGGVFYRITNRKDSDNDKDTN